jgi:hypothetical protein
MNKQMRLAVGGASLMMQLRQLDKETRQNLDLALIASSQMPNIQLEREIETEWAPQNRAERRAMKKAKRK